MSTTCRIDDRIYTINLNAKRPQTNGALISDYLESCEGGPFRFNQLCDKVCSLLASFDVGNGQYFKEAAGVLRGGWSMTILPGLPGFFARAYGSITKLAKSTASLPGVLARNTINAIQETATCISAVAYTVMPFLSISKNSEITKKLGKGAGVATIVADSCDLFKNSQDALTARSLANKVEKMSGVSSEFKEAISGTKNFHLLKVMKSVCSVSSFLCGLSFVSACFAGVPARAVIAATVSLAGTVLSIGASLYEKGLKYERIKFYDDKSVQVVQRQSESAFKRLSSKL